MKESQCVKGEGELAGAKVAQTRWHSSSLREGAIFQKVTLRKCCVTLDECRMRTFQVPMQYCSLQHWTLLLSPVTSTAGYSFLLWLHPFILSGVISPLISSSILGTYRPGEFIFQCPIISTMVGRNPLEEME